VIELFGIFLMFIVFWTIAGVLFLLIQPFWSIIDVILDNQKNSNKIIWILVLFFFWSIGGVLYSIFGTTSKALRFLTISSALPIFIIFIFASFVSYTKQGVIEKIINESFQKEGIETPEDITEGIKKVIKELIEV